MGPTLSLLLQTWFSMDMSSTSFMVTYLQCSRWSTDTTRWLKRLKVWTFIYCHLQGNQNSSGLQYKVAYWPALAVGSGVQLADTHCPNELWTAARQTYLCPASRTMAFTRNVLRKWLTIFCSKYYQILTATHLSISEGWNAELAWALRV